MKIIIYVALLCLSLYGLTFFTSNFMWYISLAAIGFVFIVIKISEHSDARYDKEKLKVQNNYILDEKQFSQAGVTVYFSEKKINIRGRKYNVNEITGWKYKSTNYQDTRDNLCNSTATILVADIDNPIHDIYFPYQDLAEIFIRRFDNARKKAGGQNFN